MFRLVSRFVLKLIGWGSIGSFPLNLPKYIVIVGPHTSGWDFIIGVLFRSALKLEKVSFLGKQELFRPPFGFIFRWLGGYPVDRSSSRNMVDVVVSILDCNEEFAIALSPEGTRKKVDKLRTGFYNIAIKAHVPIIMVGFDYGKKLAIISEPFYPTSNRDEDFKVITNFFRPVRGRYPELGMQDL